jgi:hypothetical protein
LINWDNESVPFITPEDAHAPTPTEDRSIELEAIDNLILNNRNPSE